MKMDCGCEIVLFYSINQVIEALETRPVSSALQAGRESYGAISKVEFEELKRELSDKEKQLKKYLVRILSIFSTNNAYFSCVGIIGRARENENNERAGRKIDHNCLP